MLCQSAALMVAALLTAGPAIEVVRVRIRDNTEIKALSPGRPRIGWSAHTKNAAIRAGLRLLPGESILRDSVWVQETSQRITLCYQLAFNPELRSEQRTIQLEVWVKGMLRDDPRTVDTSIDCGRKPVPDSQSRRGQSKQVSLQA